MTATRGIMARVETTFGRGEVTRVGVNCMHTRCTLPEATSVLLKMSSSFCGATPITLCVNVCAFNEHRLVPLYLDGAPEGIGHTILELAVPLSVRLSLLLDFLDL